MKTIQDSALVSSKEQFIKENIDSLNVNQRVQFYGLEGKRSNAIEEAISVGFVSMLCMTGYFIKVTPYTRRLGKSVIFSMVSGSLLGVSWYMYRNTSTDS
jgi:hypothetical protein